MTMYSYSGKIITKTVGSDAGDLAPGTYDITADGGAGGAAGASYKGGDGAKIEGQFTLTSGEKIEIVVGGMGGMGTHGGGGGGGGGSFVLADTGAGFQPLVIAAGGGGAGAGSQGGSDVGGFNSTTSGGSGDGAAGGRRAYGQDRSLGGYGGGGGAGFKSNGVNGGGAGGGGGGRDAMSGTPFYGGFAGSRSNGTAYGGSGGFGGGGGGGGGNPDGGGGGGGGGYSGGAGGNGGYGFSSGGGPAGGGSSMLENGTLTDFEGGVEAGDGVVTFVAMCFASGSRIRTTRGDVAVEDLQVADLVVTAAGEVRPIRWVGRRSVDCRHHLRPHEVMPIRIAANAFGEGWPARDLFLSPGHPVLVGADDGGNGGHLVPIMCLVNGTTIERVAVDQVTYWHVELDEHDVLLAEGLPAESYIDLGSRPWFAGADGVLYDPDMTLPGMAGRCRPVALDGPVVEAARRQLDAAFARRTTDACAWPAGDADAVAF